MHVLDPGVKVILASVLIIASFVHSSEQQCSVSPMQCGSLHTAHGGKSKALDPTS